MVKLSEWAKQHGLSYRAAYNLFKQGKLPVRTKQLETGTILVENDAKTSCKVVDEVSGRSFSLELSLDINDCGLTGEQQRELLDELSQLAESIANKLGFSVKLNKTWVP